MEITSLNFPSRLATWKEVLLGGDQTHDGLDDCRDLRDIVAKLAEAEHALMPRVIDTSEDEKCTHSSTLLPPMSDIVFFRYTRYFNDISFDA